MTMEGSDGRFDGVAGLFLCIFHREHLAYTKALRHRRMDTLVHDWEFVAGLDLNGGMARGKRFCVFMITLKSRWFLKLWHLVFCRGYFVYHSFPLLPRLLFLLHLLQNYCHIFSTRFLHVFVSLLLVLITFIPLSKNHRLIDPPSSSPFFYRRCYSFLKIVIWVAGKKCPGGWFEESGG